MLVVSVVIFSKIVKGYIHKHELEEKRLHDERLQSEKHYQETHLEEARKRHAETLANVQRVLSDASRFPAAVAAQYQRISNELEETNERVDHLDARVTKLEGQSKELSERMDRFITRGGLPT